MESVKEQVLRALEYRRGEYVSGEELGRSIYVTRNAVWKAVRALKEEGHRIVASPNRGYCLVRESAALSAAAIEKHLGERAYAFDIEVHSSLPSTNTRLKELAAAGAREGKVVVAEEQTSGRGRLGRSFFSPAKSGVYFSLLLRPVLEAEDSTLVTAAAAVAVAGAIEEVSGERAGIKWVNDVFCGGRKVSGILTEGAFDMESGRMEYIVLGVGINVVPPEGGFPEEIALAAGAVWKEGRAPHQARERLVAGVLGRFWEFYKGLPEKAFLPEYRARSVVVGRSVEVLAGDGVRCGKAIAIDDSCRLVVEFQDGEVRALSSGEVSIRRI